MSTFYRCILIAPILSVLCLLRLSAQTVRKLERGAINRSHLTLVNGDTVQRFTTTRKRPTPHLDRMYYWQGQDHIMRTLGAYNGFVLNGPYQLTDRTDHLLGSGTFKQGLKTGLWRKWRADGSLLSASRWRHGRQRGPTVTYDANSQPLRAAKTATVSPPAAGTPATPAHHWWQFRHRKTVPAAPAIPTHHWWQLRHRKAGPAIPAAVPSSDKPEKAKKPRKSPVAAPAPNLKSGS
jgi:hypothetical protein